MTSRCDRSMDSLEAVNSKTKRAYNLVAQRYYDLFRNEMNGKEYDRGLLDSFASRFQKNSLICDAGCGPSCHIGRYLFDKGIPVIGVDISDKCVEIVRQHNSEMKFVCGDISSLGFEDDSFDGIIAYYSIINTPKKFVNRIFNEFRRVLKTGGYLLVAVKAGTEEGFIYDLLWIKTEIYFALFTEEEIARYFEQAEFLMEFIEKRNPYDFEVGNQRIFAIC